MSDVKDLEKSFEQNSVLKELKEKLNQLEKENLALHKKLEEYGIEEEAYITDLEYICNKGILQLKEVVDSGFILNESQTKVLDTLHKNLRMARGQLEKKEPKGKQKSVGELLKIVKDIS